MKKRTLLTVAALAATAIAAAPPTAEAATCVASTHYTARMAPSSGTFQIATNSDCKDLNAAYTFSRSDYIRGWYRANNVWRVGSMGYQWVDTVDDSWIVLLTGVRDTTTVRGQAKYHAQNVRYVH